MSATPNINLLKILGNKFDATTAPGATADSSAGYQVGSKWIDVTANKAYNCVDATAGAAVWNEAGGGGADTNLGNTNLTFGSGRTGTLTDTLSIKDSGGTNDVFKLNTNGEIIIANGGNTYSKFFTNGDVALGGSTIIGTQAGITLHRNTLVKGEGTGSSDNCFQVLDSGNNGLFKVFGNGTTIISGTALISTEDISIQGNALVKGSDNSASTSGFKFIDSNDASKWDFRNDGNVHLGQSTTFNSTAAEIMKLTTTSGANSYLSLNSNSTSQNISLRLEQGGAAKYNVGSWNSIFTIYSFATSTSPFTIDSSNAIEMTGNVSSTSTSSNAAFIAKGDGSSQDGYVQLNCSQNSHGIKLKSPPHSAAASYTLTFPNDTGSNGQFLKTNGSGVLSWGAAGSSSPLTTKGDVYTYDTADARLPVGTNGQALIANSSTATGLEWQNLPGQSTGSGTKVLVKGAMSADQTVGTSSPVVEFVDSGTPAGGAFDVNGEWDNTNHRFTVASSGAGTYLVQSQIFLTNGTGWSTLYLYKNGSVYSAFGGNGTDTTATWDNLDGTIAIDLVVGDYIDIRAYSSNTGTISFSSWPTRQAFSINKIGESVTVNNVTLQTLNKTFTLQEPTASDDITVFRTDVAITVQEVIACSTGSSPSTTYQLKHHTDRSNAGNALTTSAATTSTTTGDTASLSDATIPANSWVWIETTAASGTSVYLSVDIRYTED